MLSPPEITALLATRTNALGSLHAKMARLEDVVYGRANLPRNELEPGDEAAVPNLIARGLDQLAMRVASTQPMPMFSPLRPGIKSSEQRARDRRDVTLGWWETDNLSLKRRHRARHLLGYATSPALVRPNLKQRRPEWIVRKPREALPGPCDGMVPDDCLFAYRQSASWVKRAYPGSLGFMSPDDADAAVRLVEYIDSEQVTLLACGTTSGSVYGSEHDTWGDRWYFSNSTGHSTDYTVKLVEYPNRTGRPWVVAPWSIGLDDPHSVFEQSIGLYLKMARLMALEELAIEQGIFPEPWLEPLGPGGATPAVTVPADARSGRVGIVKDGRLNFKQVQPGFAALQAIDRYERAIRNDTGTSADLSGESGSNIRTGRRGESLLSATIDHDIAENQELLGASQAEENKIAIAIDKAYFSGSKPINVAWRGAKSARTYTTADTWETDEHVVRYPITGTDANALTIQVGQLVGTNLLSVQSAREMHPYIADAETEKDRIVAEGVMAALVSSIQTQAADPAGPYQPDDLAYMVDLVVTGKMELPAAVMKTQARAQERQASIAPEGTPAGPVAPGSPEAQPGLAPPGMGAEVPTTIPEVGPSQSNLSSLLNSLRTTRTSSAAAQAGVG